MPFIALQCPVVSHCVLDNVRRKCLPEVHFLKYIWEWNEQGFVISVISMTRTRPQKQCAMWPLCMQLAWSLAALHHQPSQKLLKSMCAVASPALSEFTADNLATLVWSLAELGLESKEGGWHQEEEVPLDEGGTGSASDLAEPGASSTKLGPEGIYGVLNGDGGAHEESSK
jgi:hypothetical protein